MAILEQSTNNYYRVDFNKSSIKGLGVYVYFYYYETLEDRQKEKDRIEPITRFIEKLRVISKEKYEELVTLLKEQGITEKDADSNGMINKKTYPLLYEKQIEIIFYNDFIPFLTSNFIITTKQDDLPNNYIKFIENIKALGYMEEWIADPIKLKGGAELYCGDYNGETINHEFFYNKLKEKMNKSIVDC